MNNPEPQTHLNEIKAQAKIISSATPKNPATTAAVEALLRAAEALAQACQHPEHPDRTGEIDPVTGRPYPGQKVRIDPKTGEPYPGQK